MVADTVLDPDLLDRTARAVDDVPVTTIVATAGAGKSTLASAVVERTGRRAAWLPFDELDDDPASVVELLVRAQQQGWVLTEHDITYHPRAAGTRSKVSGSVTGTLRTARDFAKVLP